MWNLFVLDKMLLPLICLGIFYAGSAICNPVETDTETEDIYRLPTNMLSEDVLDYNVVLTLPENFDKNLEYKGRVDIRFKVGSNKQSSLLVHYTHGLTKNDIRIFDLELTENVLNIKSVTQKQVELHEILLDAAVFEAEKNYVISFNFTGKLDDQSMYGFYLSKYGVNE